MRHVYSDLPNNVDGITGECFSDARIIILGDLDENLIPLDLRSSERKPLLASYTDAAGRLVVESITRHYSEEDKGGQILILTSLDLNKRGLPSLFGYSDWARGIAIVSTFRLTLGASTSRLRLRLANVIAHELAHLDGLKHCRTPDCLMHPAQSPDHIDRRGWKPCGDCPRSGSSRRILMMVGTASACLLLFAGLDLFGDLIRPSKTPFGCGSISAAGQQYILYQGRALLAEHEDGNRRPIPCSSPAAADTLNRLFNDLGSGDLEVVKTKDGGAVVSYEGVELIEALRGEGAGETPDSLARVWANELQTIIHGKGLNTESCPSCHIARAAEVELAAHKKRVN